MKKYSYLLPRKRVEVMDKNGVITRSRWYYSRNRILRMVRDCGWSVERYKGAP